MKVVLVVCQLNADRLDSAAGFATWLSVCDNFD